MDNREERITAEIEALITALRRNANEGLKEQIHSYARKVFQATPARPSTDSPAELKERITQKVAQQGEQRIVLACQDLTQRFLSNSAVYRKNEVLRMLLKLSEMNQQDDSIKLLT